MTCDACNLAATNPRDWGEMIAGCDGCLARALAGIGAHLESKEAGKMTAGYIETLKTVFGERWKEGAELVKGWGAVMGQKHA